MGAPFQKCWVQQGRQNRLGSAVIEDLGLSSSPMKEESGMGFNINKTETAAASVQISGDIYHL